MLVTLDSHMRGYARMIRWPQSIGSARAGVSTEQPDCLSFNLAEGKKKREPPFACRHNLDLYPTNMGKIQAQFGRADVQSALVEVLTPLRAERVTGQKRRGDSQTIPHRHDGSGQTKSNAKVILGDPVASLLSADHPGVRHFECTDSLSRLEPLVSVPAWSAGQDEKDTPNHALPFASQR
jgi:hypothetical protein